MGVGAKKMANKSCSKNVGKLCGNHDAPSCEKCLDGVVFYTSNTYTMIIIITIPNPNIFINILAGAFNYENASILF